jgi:hypothetical protein
MAWPVQPITSNGQITNYLVAAYDSYRNYDGQGSVVGDTTVWATTSDVEDSSVYAFAHSTDASRLDLVAINKTGSAMSVAFDIANAPTLATAHLYQLTSSKVGVVAVSGSAPTPTCSCATCGFAYSLPAMSVTTIVLQ